MFGSIEDIILEEKNSGLSFWEVVRDNDCNEEGTDKKLSFEKMKNTYIAMKEADKNYDATCKSASGLVGGEGEKLKKRVDAGQMIAGDFVGRVAERAVKMAESNACMKRIVAAPTAGSCGVLPAVFISVQEKGNFDDDTMTKALYVAAGIGSVIASRASLSGAECGCQAEIGAASAMAAGAVAFLYGGKGDVIASAAALAMKNLLGLTCDPVAGLVEVPCVKRNVVGSVNAITSADLALAGISSKIPADQVFDAMYSIGRAMSETLRETAKGGLATTPEGVKVMKKIVL